MQKFLLLFILSICYIYANVGSVVAVDGTVLIVRGNIEKKVKINDSVKEEDSIKSIGNSKVQILFEDKTVVTIGKDSILNIQEYFVDSSANSSVKLNIPIGIFRVMTGKISKISPSKFKLKTKNATIGIRGTIFSGVTSNKIDKIACLKGVIIVESQGKSVDLHEGKIIYIKEGEIPSTPEKYKTDDIEDIEIFSQVSVESKKLVNDIVESMEWNDEYVVDRNLESSFLRNLDEIKNANNKAATYNLYLDSSLNKLYELLEEKYFEIDADGFAVNEYQDVFSDGYIPLGFTYFTVDEPMGDSMSDLIQAIPFYVRRHEENIKRTPESKIIEYMGGIDPWTNEVYSYWDGRATGRKLVSFMGNVIGHMETLTEDKKVFLIDPMDNESSVLIDFGNRFMTSYFRYLVPNYNLDKRSEASFDISFVGEEYLASTGFNAWGNGYIIQSGRFYGKNLNQVSANFALDEFDSRTYGNFVANNNAEYDVNKLFMGEDEFFSWGYWNTEVMGNLGAWIEPKIQNTSVEAISDYIVQQQRYAYNGYLIGTFNREYERLSTQAMDGSFSLNMDFGNSTIDGYYKLYTDEEWFEVSIKGELDARGFKGSEFIQNSRMSTTKIKSVEIGGQFFGEDAQKIGGGIRFETYDGGIGIAAFDGTKSE